MFVAPKFILPLGPFLPKRSKLTLPLLAGRNATREINAFEFFWTLLLLLSKRFPLLEAIKIRESQTKTFLPPPTFCARCLMSASWGHNHELEAEHKPSPSLALPLLFAFAWDERILSSYLHLSCVRRFMEQQWGDRDGETVLKVSFPNKSGSALSADRKSRSRTGTTVWHNFTMKCSIK